MAVQIGKLLAPSDTPKASKGETRSLGEQECKDCNVLIPDFVQECVVPDFDMWYPWYPLCDKCLERNEQESEDSDPTPCQKREKEYMIMCPASMRETDASRFNVAKLQTVLDHKLHKKGLILHGKTGMGKTRHMWLLIRELMVNRGRDVRVYDAIEMKENLAEAHTRKFAHKDMINGLVACDVLCIDDLGKEKPSEAWEQDLFTIIDRRMLHQRPIVITTNFVGDSLTQRYGDIERMEPLVRKLRDSCDSVSFERYPMG